jgi:hypothetical protein
MGREKVSARGKEIRSESSEEEEEERRSSGEEYGIHVHEKRSRPQDPPSRAQGRGRGHDGNPILKKRTTIIGARTKRPSTADEVGDRYDDNMDLSLYVQMVVPVHPPKCMLTVKFHQPSHEFTFGVGITFVSYPMVLTPVV